VRVWLLMRSDQFEPGYIDGNTYTYAGKPAYTPPNDGFRRLLVSRTIQIRNSRTM
jgi:hypothetical protein